MEGMDVISGILFSFQLLILEGAFLADREKKRGFGVRFILSTAVCLSASCLFFEGLSRIGQNSYLAAILFYIGVFVLSMLKIVVCYELDFIEIIFVGTGGYAVEHITFAVTRTLQFVMEWDAGTIGVFWNRLVFRIAAYIVSAVLVYFLLIRKNRLKEEFKKNDIRLEQMALFVLLAATVLSVFYSSPRFETESPVLSNIICPMYSTLCCVFVLIMEYYIFRENRLSREKETMEQMLQISQNQQKSSKEAINIINMKCHDLKHQMKALIKMEDTGARSEYVEEIRKAISIYDAAYQTGCEALDYILREKMLLSEEHHVTFSCMADGEAISFMRPADIYALMGNALDNALESVIKADEDKRIISIQVMRRKQMILLHVENTCTEMPQFQDGLPVTVKEDKDYHGFGVKSIRYIAERYQGNVIMRAGNGKFYLDILFPET